METVMVRAGMAAKQLMGVISERVREDRGDGVLGWLIGVVVVALAAVALWTAWDVIFDRELERLEGIGTVDAG